MKSKKKLVKLTRKGFAYFAVFWAIVALIIFGPPENLTKNTNSAPVEGSLAIHFIDVGQADAAVILCGGEVMMIDGGNAADSSLVYSYLTNTLGIEHIDYMIATHPHEDHIGGLSGALNACTVGVVYSPVMEYSSKVFESLVKYTNQQGRKMTIPDMGETILLGEAKVQFISPGKQYSDINDQSIVVRIEFGETSFLFMGDAETEAEDDLINSRYDLSATLLKVGHHGSSSSSSYAFLREVMPEYAVISVGEGNSYGHPSENVISRLQDAGATIYRTDQNGHIVVVSDGKKLSFSYQKGSVAANEQTRTSSGRTLSLSEVLDEMADDLAAFIEKTWMDLISSLR